MIAHRLQCQLAQVRFHTPTIIFLPDLLTTNSLTLNSACFAFFLRALRGSESKRPMFLFDRQADLTA